MFNLSCLNLINKEERFFWTLSIQEMVTVLLTSVPLEMLIRSSRKPSFPLHPTFHAPKNLLALQRSAQVLTYSLRNLKSKPLLLYPMKMPLLSNVV